MKKVSTILAALAVVICLIASIPVPAAAVVAVPTSTLTVASDTSTQWSANGTSWQPAVACFVYSGWPTIPGATWIWRTATTDVVAEYNSVPAGGWYFRRTFSLPANATNISGSIKIDDDNSYSLSVNGHAVGGAGTMSKDGPDPSPYTWQTVNTWDITSYLTPGQNTISIRALNYFSTGDYTSNPAGLIFLATINSTTPAALSVSVPTPTTATIGTPYTLTPTASGGTPPYTWSTINKPSWLSLNASTGVMTGTPGTSAVTVTFTLQVKDKNGTQATKDLTITVNPAPLPTITVTTPTTATIGTAYTLTPTASGGAGAPYRQRREYWSVVGKGRQSGG